MMSYFKQVSEMNRNMLEAGKGKFESFDVKTAQNGIEAYGIRCGKKDFIYLYNSTVTSENIWFNSSVAPGMKSKMILFDCETGRYSDLKFKVLPDKSIDIDQLKLQPAGNVILIWE
jgi:hypothetical protein